MRLQLSPRENQVAELVATGASNKEIAYQLDLSPKTITNTLTRVFAKTGARCRTELAVQVVRGNAVALDQN
jgi:DNA-binding NarL/FixJ family response regulator